jgi:hypothetical protein
LQLVSPSELRLHAQADIVPEMGRVARWSNRRVWDAVVGGIVGAVVASVGAYLLYYKQRADSRRDAEQRAKESGLQSQQEAARKQLQCAYSAKTWLSNLPSSANASAAPERQGEIKDEAMRRMNKCHEVWDFEHIKVDSEDVKSVMWRLDEQLSAVLREVVGGNPSPKLSALNESLKALKDTANRRLDARL